MRTQVSGETGLSKVHLWACTLYMPWTPCGDKRQRSLQVTSSAGVWKAQAE